MSNLLASPVQKQVERGEPTCAVLANLMLYQTAWFACVTGAAFGLAGAGTAVALLVVAARLWVAADRWSELKVIGVSGVVGGAWESLMVGMDWVRYAGEAPNGWPPAWILALWLAFATTFNSSLRRFHARPYIASVLGLIGGPLAWWAGERLGALEFPHQGFSLFVIGVGWSLMMPLLLALTAAMMKASEDGRSDREDCHV